MKSSVKSLGLFLLLCIFVPGTLSKLTDGIGELSTNILKTSFKEGENTVHSAYSLSIVLGMCLAGARGETSEAIQKSLDLSGLSESDISDKFKNITSKIAEIQHENFIIHEANRLYLDQKFPVSENFKNKVIGTFEAESLNVDFTGNGEKVRGEINDFVKNETKGLIPSILDQPLEAGTAIAAINAIYLKGTWKTKLQNKTSDDKFNDLECSDKPGQTANWMTVESKFHYAHSSDLKSTVVVLPYESVSNTSTASMILVLPSETHQCNLSEYLETHLSWKNVLKALNETVLEKIRLTMPKVELESNLNMKDILTKTGLEQLFSAKANFTGMVDDDHQNASLKISEFVHKAKLSIDETGTTAAAASSATFVLKSAPSISQHPPHIVLNRSFFAFIVLNQTDGSILPLFSAMVNKV